MPLQILVHSRAEVEAIWKSKARAENYAEYVAFLNSLDVGEGFRVDIDKGDKNADSARSQKRNFNDAAKERVKVARDDKGHIVLDANGAATPILGADGNPIPDPVILRWKAATHVDKKKGKDGKEVETTVIDNFEVLAVAAGEIKKRAPRAPTEVVDVPGDHSKTEKGAKVTLADGREAVYDGKAKWRAPKVAAPATPSTNGTANVGTPATTTTETPATV